MRTQPPAAHPGETAAPPSLRAQALAAALIAISGLLAYSNSFHGPFVFDDLGSIVENPTIHHLRSLGTVFSGPAANGLTVSARPVLNLSLALNYALGGTAVKGYHVVNLAIHSLAGIALFSVLRRTLQQPLLRSRYGGFAYWLALAAAVLWSVHPLQTEAVTYVIQRAESLMGLFFLLAFYCFIRATEGDPWKIWASLTVTACLAGMATKEVMAVAPALAFLYDRTFVAGSWAAAWKRRRNLYLVLALTWLPLAYLVYSSAGRGGSAGFCVGISPSAYAATQIHAILLYLKLAIWPHPLVFDYGIGLVGDWSRLWLPALLLVAMLAGTVAALRRNAAIGFAAAWFFTLLAPSSSFLPVATQTIAEHRMYLPLAAVITLGVVACYRLAGRWCVVAFALLAAQGMVATRARNGAYRSELALWGDTAANYPRNGRGHLNFGNALLARGQTADAASEYRKALETQPDSVPAHANLSAVYLQLGHAEVAAAEARTALRLEPLCTNAEINLANALVRLGTPAEAVPHYEAALRPDDRAVRSNLDQARALLAPNVSSPEVPIPLRGP